MTEDSTTCSSPEKASADSKSKSASEAKLLRIYINDHRAGAAAGVALCRRMAKQHRSTPLGEVAAELAEAIEDDRRVLERFARTHAIAPNLLKEIAARFGEIAGRAKLNGYLIHRSPLSPILELEALLAGIDAKRSLWRSLEAADLPSCDIDFRILIARATGQKALLGPQHSDGPSGRSNPTPTCLHPLRTRRPADKNPTVATEPASNP